ncbi:MAG TPA: VOC family protein [Stellaceae bacterium]|nr:VOC family protein [Stellaceae bacterium]
MSTAIRPRLTHTGVFVRDVSKMVDFYTKTLGLMVADRGKAGESELAFLTSAADEHHQLVLVSGRPPEGMSTINQLSFLVDGLDQVKTMFERIKAAGVTEYRQTSHGNALSVYFHDPEGNRVEIYTHTPWHIPQPHGVPVDLSKPTEEILAETEKHCRETPGFMPRAEWEAQQARLLSERR